MLMCEIVVVK